MSWQIDLSELNMPTTSTYGYHWRKALTGAGVMTPGGKPTYTPHSLLRLDGPRERRADP
ncbi:hypothetical protein [Streptomyces sp. NPDC051576]|uniref:hypothetical protein n=1 Tax=Streptomyces sp. NPDC051576 TaxID=3155803 RepID=UPI00343504B0